MSRFRAMWLLVVVALAGCGLLPADPVPADGPQTATECEPPLAFEGETTIAELGLADAIPNVGGDATRRGVILITRDTVTWEEFAPPGAPAAVPAGQMLCVTWEDGSGLATLLHQRFNGELGARSDVADSVGFPLAPIVVGLAVLLLAIAVSWLAFRRDAPHAA